MLPVFACSIKSTLGDDTAEMKIITLLRNRREGKYMYRFEDKVCLCCQLQ